jgi:hypothetical protein
MRNALAVGFVLFLATPANAFDWRGGRGEYWGEVLQARAEYRLCPAEMKALIETQRWRANEQALNQFGRVRPLGVTQPRPTPPTQPGR